MTRISSIVATTTAVLVAVSTMCSLASCFDQTLCAGSDSTGRCSPDPYPVTKSGGQRNMFIDFADKHHFDDGNRPGCYRIDYTTKDPGDIQVYASFSCDGTPSHKCRKCFKDGFDRLRDGCRNRAGGNFLLENCCVRYERYNICG